MSCPPLPVRSKSGTLRASDPTGRLAGRSVQRVRGQTARRRPHGFADTTRRAQRCWRGRVWAASGLRKNVSRRPAPKSIWSVAPALAGKHAPRTSRTQQPPGSQRRGWWTISRSSRRAATPATRPSGRMNRVKHQKRQMPKNAEIAAGWDPDERKWLEEFLHRYRWDERNRARSGWSARIGDGCDQGVLSHQG